MEAVQCLPLSTLVVWLLPGVLPNSAVPAKHGNWTFKNALLREALVPLEVRLTLHLTAPAGSTKHPSIEKSLEP